MQVDWQEVVDRQPKGYVELSDGKRVIHGPIENMQINEGDFVVINLKWVARAELDKVGLPSGSWKVAEDREKAVVFPNIVVPYVIEDTPEKGPRVRFAGRNILYFNEVDGLDPSKVEGLVLDEKKDETVTAN